MITCDSCGAQWRLVPPPAWLPTRFGAFPVYCPRCGAILTVMNTSGWSVTSPDREISPSPNEIPGSTFDRECSGCSRVFRVTVGTGPGLDVLVCPFCGTGLGLALKGSTLTLVRDVPVPQDTTPTPSPEETPPTRPLGEEERSSQTEPGKAWLPLLVGSAGLFLLLRRRR